MKRDVSVMGLCTSATMLGCCSSKYDQALHDQHSPVVSRLLLSLPPHPGPRQQLLWAAQYRCYRADTWAQISENLHTCENGTGLSGTEKQGYKYCKGKVEAEYGIDQI